MDTVLWFHSGSSDKIWGVVDYNGRAVTFWGRRTSELAFKLLSDSEQRKIEKTIEKKKASGYVETTFDALNDITPGWKSNFDQMLMMAILGDNYRHTTLGTILGK